MLFRSFVGTFGNLSVHVSPQACLFCTDKASEVLTTIVKEIAVFVNKK